jgi:prolyl oligopeptidase
MSRCKTGWLFGLFCAALFIPERAASQQNYPPVRRSDQTDVYHGVTVADPYRWLEDANADETKRWVKAQDDFVRICPCGWKWAASMRNRVCAT